MASTVSIEVSIDDKGALHGLDEINKALQDTGNKGKVAFQGMEDAQTKTHAATRLFTRYLGVEMPRTLEGVIAKSTMVQNVMSMAFNGIVVAALAQTLVNVLVPAIESVINYVHRYQDTVNSVIENEVKIGNKLNLEAQERNKQIALEAKKAGATETMKIEMQLQYDLTELHKKQQTALYNNDVNAYRELKKEETNLEKNAAAQKSAIWRDLGQQYKKEMSAAYQEAGMIGLSEFAKIDAQEMKALSDIAERQKQHGSTPGIPGYVATALSGAARSSAQAQREEMLRKNAFEENQILISAQAEAATAIDRIQLELLAKLDDIEEKKRKSGLETPKAIQAAWIEYHEKLLELNTERWNREKETEAARRQLWEGTMDLETQAALASAEPWQRASEAAKASVARELYELGKLGAVYGPDGELLMKNDEYLRRRNALWQRYGSEMRDINRAMTASLADDLVGIFDDITSGNIGKTILNQFKRLIAQVVAQWALGFQSVRDMWGQGQMNGGGLLGGLLGKLFGIGIGAMPGAVAMPGRDLDSTIGSGSIFLGGAGDFAPGFNGTLGYDNAGVGVFSSLGGSLLNPGGIGIGGGFGPPPMPLSGTTSTLAGGVPVSSMTNTAAPFLNLGKLFSHDLSIGGKTLMKGPALGVSGLMLGISGIASGSPVMGGIGGAMTGFSMGGPLGAMVGGVAGLFGALIGRPDKTTLAHSLAENLIAQSGAGAAVQSFLNYSGDAQTAINALSAASNTVKERLVMSGQFGGAGYTEYKVWGKMLGDQIAGVKALEAERNRRAGLDFGVPQFAAGGTFDIDRVPIGLRTGPDSGLAILHDGERVTNPKRPGAAPDSGSVVIVPLPMNQSAIQFWLDNGGTEAILGSMKQAKLEGRF